MENKSDEESREVWVLQTLLLTMIYAAYSGDIKIFERGLALQSVLGNVLLLPHLGRETKLMLVSSYCENKPKKLKSKKTV